MALKVLIVDDEFPARQELRCILEDIGNIHIVGECSNGQQALDFIRDNQMDVVFLDIEMPLIDGLKVAQKILEIENAPKFVFSTGFSEFAVRAFELNAADYILKPYTQERLELTVAKLTKGIKAEHQFNSEAYGSRMAPSRLSVWHNERLILLEPENEILFFKSANRKTLIYTLKDVIETTLLLKTLEERFENRGFIRVHKSYIVNYTKVRELLPWFNDTYILKLKDYEGEDIPISRHFLPNFKKFMQI